ncbi:MAG: hypothetical protein NVS1B11_29260 [Terriglobales bacterium]
MAGKFSSKTTAAAAQSKLVEPSTGKMPSTIPTDTLKAIFSGVIPCVTKVTIGSTNLLLMVCFTKSVNADGLRKAGFRILHQAQ